MLVMLMLYLLLTASVINGMTDERLIAVGLFMAVL